MDGSGMSNTRLAILPGLTHYSICSSPALPATVTPFLDAAMPGAQVNQANAEPLSRPE